jgi:hypothetical protein
MCARLLEQKTESSTTKQPLQKRCVHIIGSQIDIIKNAPLAQLNIRMFLNARQADAKLWRLAINDKRCHQSANGTRPFYLRPTLCQLLSSPSSAGGAAAAAGGGALRSVNKNKMKISHLN